MEHISNSDTLKTTFRKRFDKLRGGLSNTEFAKKIGLSRQTVGFFLNGDRLPSAENLVDIAKKCNVSVDYLLGISACPATDDKIKATCEYTGLTVENVEFLNSLNCSDKRIIDLINSIYEQGGFLDWLEDIAADTDRIKEKTQNFDSLAEIVDDLQIGTIIREKAMMSILIKEMAASKLIAWERFNDIYNKLTGYNEVKDSLEKRKRLMDEVELNFYKEMK